MHSQIQTFFAWLLYRLLGPDGQQCIDEYCVVHHRRLQAPQAALNRDDEPLYRLKVQRITISHQVQKFSSRQAPLQAAATDLETVLGWYDFSLWHSI